MPAGLRGSELREAGRRQLRGQGLVRAAARREELASSQHHAAGEERGGGGCTRPAPARSQTHTFTFQVSTAEDNGVLLYNGDNEPIAVELHQGRVRVTYDPGNQPASAIYRYARESGLRAAERLQVALSAASGRQLRVD